MGPVTARGVAALAVGLAVAVPGCTSLEKAPGPAGAEPGAAGAGFAEARRARGAPERMVVRSGDLGVEVADPEAVAPEAERLVKEAGGFVEQSRTAADSDVWLRCRVPAGELDRVMDAIAALGDEQSRAVSAADVTDQYADLETRLRNSRALLERLRGLLDRASDVEDVLAIEKELNRVQSEVETMQARFDRLKSQVELSALSVHLERERILGPVGYLAWGFWWGFSKLFVIR